MDVEAGYFTEKDGTFVPAEDAHGPWSPGQLHGRLVAGIVADAIDRIAAPENLVCGRITVDMFRVVPLEPLRIETEVLRRGRRIRVLDVCLTAGGVEAARARALILRPGEQPPGNVWRVPAWEAPPADSVVPSPILRHDGSRLETGYELRPITALPPTGREPTRVWVRETRALVCGKALTPFVRAALASDLASPMSSWGDRGLRFINADVSLYLHRRPVGEWIGIQSAGHLSESGVGFGTCAIHDSAGPIGFSSVSSVAAVRR
jgi:hypothetical protein